MGRTAVWAFKKLDALDGKTGVVHCDSHVATALLAAGDVQDLRDGHRLKRIESCYQTKVMTPVLDDLDDLPPDPKPVKQKARNEHHRKH